MRNIGIVAVLAAAVFSVSCGDTRGGVTGAESGSGQPTDLSNLGLTEISSLEFAGGKTTLNLGDLTGDYLLIVNSVDATPATYSLQLAAASAPSLSLSQALAVEGAEDSEECLFHQYLREMEPVFSESSEFEPVARSSLAALTTGPGEGSEETFRVLSTMTSLAQYRQVTATLRLATENLFVYVDNNAADQVSDSDLETLAEGFESVALPRERNFFGRESDINGDGHISILMSCVTNGMATSGGIVTGFFFPGDLYAASSSNPASNEEEIFYTLVPDPSGRCGVPISAEFAINNILPGVLAHEYQHMASYNQHVLVNHSSTETPWLNEALSHLAEDLTGFGNENPSRVKLFLDQPSTTALIPPTSPRLAERGAAYLFLRYLYEQHPDGAGFLQTLSSGRYTGVNNIVAAFSDTGSAGGTGSADPDFDEFAEFVRRWSVAVALSDTGLTSDARYNYEERGTDPETGNPTGICLRCEANDGRDTVLAGPAIKEVSSYPIATSLVASASQFYLMTSVPKALDISSSGQPTLAGSILRLER